MLLCTLILPSIVQESVTNAGGNGLVLCISNNNVHCDGDFSS